MKESERILELEGQLESTRAELNEMRKAAERRDVADQLAAELRQRGFPDSVAAETAGTLAGEVVRVRGELVHGPRLGVANIVTGHLETRPWLQRASKAADAGPAPSETWDINKAVADLKYNQEWKEKDPEGHKKAWTAHIRAQAEKQKQWV